MQLLNDSIDQHINRRKTDRQAFYLKRGLFWAGLFLFIFLFTVIIVDISILLSETVRWILLGQAVAVIAILLWQLWLRPRNRYTTRDAIVELEQQYGDDSQLIQTAHQIEHNNTAFNKEMEKKVVLSAKSLLGLNEGYTPSPFRKYHRYVKILKRLSIVFLILFISNRSMRVGMSRILYPPTQMHYTQITLIGPQQISLGEPVKIEVLTRGRKTNEAWLYLSKNDDQWEKVQLKKQNSRLYNIHLTDMERSFKYFVKAGDGKTFLHSVHVVAPPMIDTIWAKVTYPTYMQKKCDTLSGGKLKAYLGSQIDLHVQISQKMKEAFISFPNGTNKPLHINKNKLNISFNVRDTTAGSYAIYGTDYKGMLLKKQKFTMEILPDKLPTVKIVDPSKDIQVTPITEVPIKIYAYDDLGLSEIGLTARIGKEEHQIAHFTMKDSIVLDQTKIAKLLLEKYPINLKTNVRVFAWAKDRNPNQKRRAVSIMRGIDIRQYRLRYALPEESEGGMPMQASSQQIMKLEQMIQVQRNVLSKTFKYSEEGGKFTERERFVKIEKDLSNQATDLYGKLQRKNPNAGALKEAAQKLTSAASHLQANNLKEAVTDEDLALCDMMQLRDELLKVLNKKKSGSCSCENSCDALTELALDVDKLIEQEEKTRKLHQQHVNNPDNDKFLATLALQRKCLVDAGELNAMLEIHPDGTPLNMTRMKETIGTMEQCKKLLEADKNALDELDDAIFQLKELSIHLRGLDSPNASATLNKAKQLAEKASEKLRKQAKEEKSIGRRDSSKESCNKPDEDEKKKEKKKEGEKKKDGKKEGSKEGKKEGEKPGSKKGSKPGSKEGSKPGQNQGSQAGGSSQGGNNAGSLNSMNNASIEQIARNTAMIQDWLNKMTQQNQQEEQDDVFQKERTKELMEEAELERLAKELDDAGENPNPQQLEQLANKFDKLSKLLDKELKNLTMSKLNRLNSSHKQAKQLLAQHAKGQEINGQELYDLSKELSSYNDSQLTQLANKLSGSGNSNQVDDLKQVAGRLNQLIEELIEQEIAHGKDIKIPSKYSKMVEEYFKVLSDDMDDELDQ
ncbi:hypothetical protein EYV94_16280 [Puteibacter caeruleilacunae]|nr:hypothetical protein EYV94_16280 [Puteibacter caeruleilacunae]